ncbi:sporulation protein YtfJ [archaeon]|nr:sporulation protein YtfJ [archaeon]
MKTVDLKAMLDNFSKSLSAQSIFGKPVTQAGKTIIPVCAVGFGFGAGEGVSDKGGMGGGGGVMPVAVIIVDKSEVRVEPLGPVGVTLDNLVERLVEGVKSVAKKKSAGSK